LTDLSLLGHARLSHFILQIFSLQVRDCLQSPYFLKPAVVLFCLLLHVPFLRVV
jgi:hypothetical protein